MRERQNSGQAGATDAHKQTTPNPSSSVSPAAPANELHDALGQLRSSYARGLPDKVELITTALHALKRGDAPGDKLAQASILAHRLRGTAGSYGFPVVGIAAGLIEDELRALVRQDDLGAAWQRISDAERTLRDEVARASDENPSMAPPRLDDEIQGQGSTVMLVSSAPELQRRFAVSTQRSLVTAVVASTSDEALNRARTSRIDAVVLDLHLPEGPQAGIDVARRLRSLDGMAGLPVAIVADEGPLRTRIAATHAGASLFATRPISDPELVDIIRQLVAQQDAAAPRLLLVDDDPSFAQALAALLEREHLEVHTLNDADVIIETLEQVRPDLLLLDVVLPRVNGLEICRIIRANPKWQLLPILMLTGVSDQEARVDAFESGADDYLLKPIVKQELLARIRLRLDHARLVRERSSRDALTGLMTRRAFVESITARIAEAGRQGNVLSVCILDLDNFKRINDAHGHLSGDRVLAATGRALGSRFRECDLRGRWGGEEFVVALVGVDAASARGVFSRLQNDLRRIGFVGDNGDTFHATFSAGISTYPTDGQSLEDLLRVADRRLYRAKQSGRDSVCVADPS